MRAGLVAKGDYPERWVESIKYQTKEIGQSVKLKKENSIQIFPRPLVETGAPSTSGQPSQNRPTVQHRSLVDETRMTQGAPTKILIGRMLHEAVQIAHHDRESLRLRELDQDTWNFVGFDGKVILGRPTIITDINAMHHNPPKAGSSDQAPSALPRRSPKWR